uniref:Sacchrp_dh_C domain-containing protein n=1 Tax=Mesocestoides corti TaxID=53468 RepID=A0A5K3FLY5_MESCO
MCGQFSDRLLNTHLLSPSIAGEGFLVCSIDNMPSQIPVEASNYFGDRLMPYIDSFLASDATEPFECYKASPVIKNAVIASNGRLTPRFQYIDTLRRQNEARGHKVLILGAGFVVPSIVGYLIRDPNTSVTVVSNLVSDLEYIKKYFPRASVAKVDEVAEDECLGKLISRHDLVVIMTPWKFHTKVINACIAHKKNFLTASYCSPELRKLETAIENAGIIGVMEMGLDPGIDHMLAMECFDEVYRRGGKVISYKSYTGGLPAPEFADNPLRYKFSWSPEAAMSTVLNSALYLEDGKRKEIAAGGDLMDAAQRMNDLIGFNLESYPNRDSISYKDVYKLKDCETVIRGTIRYKGFAKVVRALINLGFMDTKEHPKLAPGAPSLTWHEVTCTILGIDPTSSTKTAADAIRAKLNTSEEVVQDILKLEILSDKVAELKGSPFATISQHFADIMAYGPNERDLIVMSHQIGIEWPDKRRELRVVRLVVYGEAGKGKAGLAMSRTVGIPAAIAARMILDGKIQRKGYVLPLTSDIYEPILEELKNEGIQATEVTVPL